MNIDFSKYTVKELHEACISIDDCAYPERAIEIYQRLKAFGERVTSFRSELKEKPMGLKLSFLWWSLISYEIFNQFFV
ncbi:hypothetical protein [Pseudoalteromonas sp. T1lg88]|uniref:hypothetical protein n=1 Tax=Pseudoalteromonas sp. T1lg88 TaxID=2077104 RepID=UPI000CF72C94|nr:hypothetical protein [Pseudoalteromonas sp. T1lg88]